MLQKYIVVVSLFYCFLQPQNSFAQSSQELNNQGCDALVNHDYAQAEKLFTSAFQEASKTHDSKRIRVSLNNLKELYAKQGRDDQVKRIEAIQTHLGHPAGLGTPIVRSFPMSDEEVQQPQPLQTHRILNVYHCASYKEVKATKNDVMYTWGRSNITIPETVRAGEATTPTREFAPGFNAISMGRGPRQPFEDTAQLISSAYNLNQSEVEELLKSGHNIIELSDGLLLATPENLDDNKWNCSAHVILSKHPYLSMPSCQLTLISESLQSTQEEGSVTAKIIASH